MAGKGGGAWKVAYADFVTAMMAFFMVMWLVGQSEKVKDAIAQEFSQPYASRRPMHKPYPTMKPSRTPPAPEKKDPAPRAEEPSNTRPRPPSGRKFNPTNTATMIFFADDSAELDQEARERLKRLIPWIAGKSHKIEIRGHCSRRPLPPDSPYADPWQLCYARCQATIKFLQEQGIAPERVRLSQAAGYEPYSGRTEAEWQARNARVEVALLSELVPDLVDSTTAVDTP